MSAKITMNDKQYDALARVGKKFWADTDQPVEFTMRLDKHLEISLRRTGMKPTVVVVDPAGKFS